MSWPPPPDLIDEYRLMVFPIVVGSGKRLFGDGVEMMALNLIETKTLGSSVVVLTFGPVGSVTEG